MTNSKNIILGLLFATYSFCTYAVKEIKPDKKEAKSSTEKDTVPFKYVNPALFDVPNVESFDDVDNFDYTSAESYANFDPTFDYYGIWDTVSVNPYKIDLSKKEDTTEIVLNDHYQCDYQHPFCGKVTSHFGPRGRYRYHYGIDIDLETGDSVKCAFEGTVRISRRSSTFGNVVVVRHKNGLETIYAHLSRLDVKIGDHVEAGDLLGLGGNTGRSRGSHLHFEVRYKGMAINPESIISFEYGTLVTDKLLLDKHSFNYVKDYSKYKGKSHYYTIRKGDTLGKIAQRNHISLSKLCKINGISKKTILRPGRKIRLA
ncbi:MAG TPA: M23 family metallopeptidase [Bacteroidia bacterium]|nr:M23 family metallopeptidase [Bacteroidia bacterium]